MAYELPADRPFTTAEASALGWSRAQLARLVAVGLLIRESRGWYRRIDAECDPGTRARIRAQHSPTTLIAAHTTAAAIHGLRTPTQDVRTFYACPPEQRRPDYQPGVVILPATVRKQDTTYIHGVLVTSLARTALDLARGCSLEFALVPIDHALTLGASKAELEKARKGMRGWPGTRVLDPAIAAADAASESALESMSRGSIVAAGLPLPQLQSVVRGKSGREFRADFMWRDARVIGEADGFGKYATRGEHEKEKYRDGDLKAAGWTIVHWTFEQMLVGDRPALRWLADALRVTPTSDPPRLHSRNAPRRRRVA